MAPTQQANQLIGERRGYNILSGAAPAEYVNVKANVQAGHGYGVDACGESYGIGNRVLEERHTLSDAQRQRQESGVETEYGVGHRVVNERHTVSDAELQRRANGVSTSLHDLFQLSLWHCLLLSIHKQ